MVAVLLGVLVVVAAVAVASGASAPAAPTISSGPVSPTAATGATFVFAGPSGATLECRVDAASFASCTSPKTYATGSFGAGSHTFQVQAVAGGKTSSATSYTWVVDTVAPSVTNVTSSTANGAYKAGAVIPVQVVFSEPVVVTGTPKLTLATGSPVSTAVNYTGGTGTNTLTFSYTVAAGNTSADLAYASSGALALNSGTIRDAAGNNAVLTLAAPGSAGSLSFNKDLVIDTTAPTVSSVSSTTANDFYGAGTVIPVLVVFSEPVVVTGTPQLTLATGTPASTAVNYTGGSGTSTLTFTYTVAAGNTSANLAYTSSAALALNGGTIRDAATNDAALTLASPGTSGSLSYNKARVIDTTAPAVPFLTVFPEDPNGDGIADFSWTMAVEEPSPAVTYSCQLENLAFAACNTTHTVVTTIYHDFHDIVAVNNNQQHQFVVRATDRAGNTSQTTYQWKVDQSVQFTITGGTTGLAPRTNALPPLPLDLTIHNPNNFDIKVTSLTVTIQSVTKALGAPAGPCAPADYKVVSYSGPGFVVPHGSYAMSTRAGVLAAHLPTIGMYNTTSNQDGCKGATVLLQYSGTAVKP